eukprot:751387-Prymnesium_polylepis.1
MEENLFSFVFAAVTSTWSVIEKNVAKRTRSASRSARVAAGGLPRSAEQLLEYEKRKRGSSKMGEMQSDAVEESEPPMAPYPSAPYLSRRKAAARRRRRDGGGGGGNTFIPCSVLRPLLPCFHHPPAVGPEAALQPAGSSTAAWAAHDAAALEPASSHAARATAAREEAAPAPKAADADTCEAPSTDACEAPSIVDAIGAALECSSTPLGSTPAQGPAPSPDEIRAEVYHAQYATLGHLVATAEASKDDDFAPLEPDKAPKVVAAVEEMLQTER